MKRFFIIFALVAMVLVVGCDTQKKMLVQKGKIESESKYIGGADGGNYVFIKNVNDSMIMISVHHDFTGERFNILFYHVNKDCRKNINNKNIYKQMNYYDASRREIAWKKNTINPCLVKYK